MAKQIYSQDNQQIAITTPLGKDAFLLASFNGTERISGLFHFELELWSEKETVAAKDIVGKQVTITVNIDDKKKRYFCGIINRFSAGLSRDKLRLYRAEMVPWLWYLTQVTDSRIYQKKDQAVKDVLESVFKLYGLTDYKTDGVKGKYPKTEYCVQYRESSFDFVSRLMERHGIYYFFEHTEKKHVMVLADDSSAIKDGGQKEVEYNPFFGTRVPRVNTIREWEHRYEYRAGKWSFTDYEFIKNFSGKNKTPAKILLGSAETKLKLEKEAKFEHYEYPGNVAKQADAKSLAGIRVEEEQARHHQVVGASDCPQFASGTKFKLTKHANKAENNKQYVLTSITHRVRAMTPYRLIRTRTPPPIPRPQPLGKEAQAPPPLTPLAYEKEEDYYTNQFVCIPVESTFRPAQVTPKPQIAGSQTAVVVGPKNEEIYTDEHGRVKVQFFWDRESERDEKGLCWVRVSQSIAGKGWGSIYIPRIGQEVVVTFLDGDPDRPLVTGVVYNGEQTPPYKLPANQTQTGFKSQSTKKGTTETFNELRFEDKKDSEHIYFHAEKDFERVVENNDSLKVGFDKKDKGDQTIDIFNNQKVTIGDKKASDGSQTISIWKDRTTTIQKGKESLTVKEGDRIVTVAKGDDQHIVTKGDRSVTVDTGDDKYTIKKGDRVVNVDAGDEKITIESGNLDVKISSGKGTIEAGQQILLKVGANCVKIDQAGITLKGTSVKIVGSAAVDIVGSATAKVIGGGMLTLKGGMTMIN